MAPQELLSRVKKDLLSKKEPMEPISVRIENSSKVSLSLLAASYDVKTNELLRSIINAFVDEALDEKLDHKNLEKNGLAIESDFVTLRDYIYTFHPERNPDVIISRKGFHFKIQDASLGDEVEQGNS